ncbi:MAG: preprotein translocase subunit YajC [Acidimicrobiia bacterium]|nr:preprotein translocase subunit YajC [Acidimicrobiia bacterium]
MEILFLVAIVGVMYAVVIRPQRQQMLAHRRLIESLAVGDEIITSGGVHGQVVDLDETTMVVEVAEDVQLRMERTSVAERPVVAEVVADEFTDDGELTEGDDDSVGADADGPAGEDEER